MEREPRENVELLTTNQRPVNRKENDENEIGGSECGFKSISVLLGSFLTNGLLFGIVNSYSVIYTALLTRLKGGGVENVEIKASLVGALTIGTIFFLSPLSGVLTGFFGLRMTSVIGGAIAVTGLLLSSFVVDHVEALCFTYGIIYGLGCSLAYTPSLAILGHYFEKYLGIVNGIVTIGSSVFTVIMPLLMEAVIGTYNLEWMFRVLALFSVGIVLCGLLFKPVPVTVIEKQVRTDDSSTSLLKSIVCLNLWKISKYRLWAMSMPVALFGYFVPYVHIKKFVEEVVGDKKHLINLPLQCMASTSAVGRLLFGFLSDRKGIDKILLQQISFYVIGILTIVLAFVRTFTPIVLISLGMGLFEGGFIALIGPIAFELAGSTYAAQGIGWMLGMAALPLSIGPPIAGAIHSESNDYTLAFILAGTSPIIGATLMFLVRIFGKRRAETRANGHAIPLANGNTEKGPSLLNKSNGQINQ